LKIYKILIDVEQKSQMKYKIQERENVVYKQMTIITIRLLLERMSIRHQRALTGKHAKI